MEQPVKEPLELGARHAEVIKSAIKHWVEHGSISQDQASLLSDTIVVQSFDWEKFTKYTLRLAVLCLFVAVTSVVFEDGFLKIYKHLVALPPWMRATMTCAIASGFHVVAHRRSRRLPKQTYSNEAIHAIGAIFLALAAFQLIEQLHHFYEQTLQQQENKGYHPSSKADSDRLDKQGERKKSLEHSIMGVFFGLATVYGAIGVLSSSNLIWSCSMGLLGYCFGAMAAYASGTYYLFIESPVLFVGLGLSLIGSAKLMRSAAITSPLWSTTRIWGLLYLFVSLWIMSLFGYDNYFESPDRQKHRSPLARLFLCSLIFLLAAVTSIWHGLRFDDSTTKGFGLTFLGINLYTKFFEYFWGWYKPLFFSVLAGTLAVLGKYAENVWNMRLPTM